MRRALLALTLLAAVLPAASAPARARWDTRVFAMVPRPGFPALAFVHPDGRVYEGTYDNPSGDTMASRVLEYTADGTLMRSWTIAGQTLSGPHGVQVANSDAQGRLVLLDKTPPRVLILDPDTGAQTTYASFPDLPTCPPGSAGDGSCAPSVRDEPTMLDYAAWGPDGSLYITDYQQAVLWKVPPGGGKPVVWLADTRLDGDMFGTAGIALAADRRTLLVAQASSAGAGEPDPTTGKLYALPIGADGRPGPMRLLWEGRPADAPDGFAIAKSGNVYLALAGPTNQIVEIAPDGHEVERFPQAPFGGDNGSPVPFDTVSSANFLGTRLMVANQSFESGDATHQAILDVEVGEEGLLIYVPSNAGPPAAAAPSPTLRWLRAPRGTPRGVQIVAPPPIVRCRNGVARVRVGVRVGSRSASRRLRYVRVKRTSSTDRISYTGHGELWRHPYGTKLGAFRLRGCGTRQYLTYHFGVGNARGARARRTFLIRLTG